MPLLICLRNISENFDIGVEKTESDLDNRTGEIAANAAISLF